MFDNNKFGRQIIGCSREKEVIYFLSGGAQLFGDARDKAGGYNVDHDDNAFVA